MSTGNLDKTRGDERDECAREKAKYKGEDDQTTEGVVVVDGEPDNYYREAREEGASGENTEVASSVRVQWWKDAAEDGCSAVVVS
jgi:hypothetical protein